MAAEARLWGFACYSISAPPTSGATDISLAVIHKRAKRPYSARRSELVNNCAAGQDKAGGRPALLGHRSLTTLTQVKTLGCYV